MGGIMLTLFYYSIKIRRLLWYQMKTRLETLKKQIAKRETLIKSESEKLKNDKKKLEQLETAVMSEYMTKEGISFDENFKKQLSLAKKIMASKTTEQDIADFLLYQKTLYQHETKESTMKTEGNHHV